MKSYFSFPAATLLILCASTAAAEILDGRVMRIEDGDTIVVADKNNSQYTVRLAGIDAPNRLQAFGPQAQANLGSLLSGQDVTVIWEKHTREGDILGKVMVSPPEASCRTRPECPRTLDSGLQQIVDGMAWWRIQSVEDQSAPDRAAYRHAEFDAKIHRRGLWRDANPTPPWQWLRK